MEIFKTKDYDSFLVITSNREVNKAHVKKLAQSIRRRNLLFLRPVICTPAMEVIDGQHRIAACQLLGEGYSTSRPSSARKISPYSI